MNDLRHTLTAARMHAQAIIDYGTPVGADYATGSITFGAPDDGDTVIVDGNTFTKVAAAPGAGEFTDITELEALVEAVTGVNSVVDGGDINITAAARGVDGNAITLALGGGNTGTMAISGATLTGGVDGDTITVDGNTYTCVVGTAGSDEFSDADELAALIHAESGLNAANASGIITVNVDAVGTAGNSKEATVGEGNAGTMAVTQDFEGGAAELYTDVFTMDDGLDEVEIFLNITAITAASTLDVTPQTSPDGGVTWYDAEVEAGTALAFPQKNATGKDQLYMKRAAKKVRCKLVLGGTSPTVTGEIYMNGRQD